MNGHQNGLFVSKLRGKQGVERAAITSLFERAQVITSKTSGCRVLDSTDQDERHRLDDHGSTFAAEVAAAHHHSSP